MRLSHASAPGYQRHVATRLRAHFFVLVRGEQDRIVSSFEWKDTVDMLEHLGARHNVASHPGGHELDSRLLLNIRES